jgi:hypothetical protein
MRFPFLGKLRIHHLKNRTIPWNRDVRDRPRTKGANGIDLAFGYEWKRIARALPDSWEKGL